MERIYWPEFDHPLFRHHDLSKTKMSKVMIAAKEIYDLPEEKVIDAALSFYGLHQMLDIIKKNPLMPKEHEANFVATIQEMEKVSVRMFCYSLLSSIGEMAYINANFGAGIINAEDRKVVNEEKYEKFKTSVSNNESLAKVFIDFNDPSVCQEKYFRHLYVKEAFKHFDNFTLSEFLDSMKKGFTTFFRQGSGFGGEAWASIVNNMIRFSKGEINAEIFADQCFSLEHNGGVFFNKGFIYSIENQNTLKEVLNIQASGQIFSWLFLEPRNKQYRHRLKRNNPAVYKCLYEFFLTHQNEFKPVDWSKVQEAHLKTQNKDDLDKNYDSEFDDDEDYDQNMPKLF